MHEKSIEKVSHFNDKLKWKWLMENQDKNAFLIIESDDTFIVFDEDWDGGEDVIRFDYPIGDNEGIFELLDVINIKYKVA